MTEESKESYSERERGGGEGLCTREGSGRIRTAHMWISSWEQLPGTLSDCLCTEDSQLPLAKVLHHQGVLVSEVTLLRPVATKHILVSNLALKGPVLAIFYFCFANLTQLDPSVKKEPQLRNRFHQTGLWASLWDIFLITGLMWEDPTYMGGTTRWVCPWAVSQ